MKGCSRRYIHKSKVVASASSILRASDSNPKTLQRAATKSHHYGITEWMEEVVVQCMLLLLLLSHVHSRSYHCHICKKKMPCVNFRSCFSIPVRRNYWLSALRRLSWKTFLGKLFSILQYCRIILGEQAMHLWSYSSAMLSSRPMQVPLEPEQFIVRLWVRDIIAHWKSVFARGEDSICAGWCGGRSQLEVLSLS